MVTAPPKARMKARVKAQVKARVKAQVKARMASLMSSRSTPLTKVPAAVRRVSSTTWRAASTGRRRAASSVPLLAAIALVASLAVAGCADADERRPAVVVTTNILGDVTRRIVGDEAEVTVLMKPDADPHSFAVSAREAAVIEKAALVVHNGLGLEEGVLRNVEAAAQSGVPTLAVGEHVDPIRFATATPGDAGQADRNGATDGGGSASEERPDPHFWTDPRRMAMAVDVIAERITHEVDGVDAAAVRANAARYRAEIEALDAWIRERFATVPPDRRKLVTNHHVFGYLAERYGFTVVGAVIPSGTTLASPSAADLKTLADTVRAAGVRAIFADSSQPDRLARVLATEAGLEVRVIPLFTESLSERREGGATYVAMMRSNAEAMVGGLTGR
ncbi:zinc ABC transporter substrate-binding protein AztC [Microtetraspora niveoalba]|uniref:zinc ABC transporter substrate-binding protein AztC n=1 Tax=Microtetraspora niveoalba TaxID=46175 RepID=UPI000AD69F98|nr:zinc ABC transporter substrate-binding protein AztC [Microtetraspora niveoalba]